MSYAFGLEPETEAVIRSLDSLLAELILDEIDRIAHDATEIDLESAYSFVGYYQKYVFRAANSNRNSVYPSG